MNTLKLKRLFYLFLLLFVDSAYLEGATSHDNKNDKSEIFLLTSDFETWNKKFATYLSLFTKKKQILSQRTRSGLESDCADYKVIDSIPAAGLIIDVSGNYRVSANLTFTGKQYTQAIDIKANNVRIDFDYYTLSITGGADAIHISNCSNVVINHPIITSDNSTIGYALLPSCVNNCKIVSPHVTNFASAVRTYKCVNMVINDALIKNSNWGMAIENSDAVELNRITTTGNMSGLLINSSNNCKITDSTIDAVFAVQPTLSSACIIANCSITGKERGISFLGSNFFKIRNSQIRSDDQAITFREERISSYNNIVNCAIEGKQVGISIANSNVAYGNLIMGCSVKKCGIAIDNTGTATLIRGNNFFANKVNGIANNGTNIVENAIF